MRPWIIFESIRQFLLLISAIICTWLPFVIFKIDFSARPREIVTFIPIAAAVVLLILTGTFYYEYLINYKLLAMSNLFIISSAFSMYCLLIVKLARDHMKAAQNTNIFGNSENNINIS